MSILAWGAITPPRAGSPNVTVSAIEVQAVTAMADVDLIRQLDYTTESVVFDLVLA